MTAPKAVRLAVVDGRITHANGHLELKLHGQARAQAHADILSFMDSVGRANGKHVVYNSSIVNIARQDPSLLLEPIPARYPLVRTSKESWANADSVWKSFSAWYGNWLTKALDPDIACDGAVEIALQSGIHPDDASVWPTGALLSSEGWATNPRRLALALRYGASPESSGSDWHDDYLCRALSLVRFGMMGVSREQELRDGVQCAHMLLDAGAVSIDPPSVPSAGAGDSGQATKLLTAIGHLTDSNGVHTLTTELQRLVNNLAKRLKSAGADIDRPNGVMRLPPVVQSLRSLNIDFACELIRMGCNTAVRTTNRSPNQGGVESLEREAYKAGKEAFVTRIMQAQMERQISQADSRVPANEPVIGTARRSLRAV
jgi:hypothetical protein